MAKSVKILVTGPYRSGSTAIYNLTRCICEFHGPTYGVFEDQYNPDAAGQYQFEVIKAHKFKPELVKWADVIITVFREPEEALESMQRFTAFDGKQYGIADALRGLAWWGHYQQYTDFSINFAQIDRCPEKLAARIAGTIGVKVRPKEVVKAFQAIKPPESGYDPVTLLHANHITK